STVTVGRFQVSPSKEIPENTPTQTPPVVPPDNRIPAENQQNLTLLPSCESPRVLSSADQPETQKHQKEDRGGQIDEQDVDDDDEEETPVDKKYRRKKGRRLDCGPTLMGTSVDSGFSVDVEGRMWDGNTGSPPYATPLHNLWMSYTRSSSYLSSDESESEDDEMWGELQELRE
ncbi:hypothetical protein M9458_025850, partial [Cirrhinus mrigala]